MWACAAGDPVAANARPRSFARGVLTVECASSIWANELTYLGGQILARMTEVDPAHPVRRLRFVTRRAPAPAPRPAGGGHAGAPAPPPSGRQGDSPPAAKKRRRDEAIDTADLAAAAEGAQKVGDERLRRAILAALGAAPTASRPAPPVGPSVNQKK